MDLPDEAERRTIFEIHLRLRRQDPSHFDLARLVSAAEGFSGAEIEQAVIASLLRALHVLHVSERSTARSGRSAARSVIGRAPHRLIGRAPNETISLELGRT